MTQERKNIIISAIIFGSIFAAGHIAAQVFTAISNCT